MPSSKDREVDVLDDRPREKIHRSKSERKDRDREREKERRRDRDRETDRDKDSFLSSLSSSHRHTYTSYRTSKSLKLRPTDSETHSRSHRRHKTKDMDRDELEDGSAASRSMVDLVPELSRGLGSERGSLPYPSFSRAHSKEALHSKEDVSSSPGARRRDPLTPDTTDLGGGSEMRRSMSVDSPFAARKSSTARKDARQDDRPPSPPETDVSGQRKRPESPVSGKEGEAPERRPSSRGSRGSWVSRSTSKHESKSRVSKTSSQATFVMRPASSARAPRREDHRAPESEITDASTVEPGPAAAAPQQRNGPVARPAPTEAGDYSPESAIDVSPQTPTHTPQFPPPPMIPEEKNHYSTSDVPTPSATPFTPAPPPPPPPPPPPTFNLLEVPRVDYLLQNGGLPHPVPKTFLSVLPRQNGTRPSNPPLQGAETLFAPFFNLLNQYQTVLSGHGSMAVATGHRTVARRLLDRLENVFSRDLCPDGCPCIICERSGQPRRGLGWGEVLERVSGRVELPPWPPFDFTVLGSKAVEELADVPPRPSSPVKVDPDIAEEFREHYLRQTKRVRAAVDKWMSSCEKTAAGAAPPPQDVDDETLAFAILTNLEQEDRPYFNALLAGSRELQSPLRAPTPVRRPRNDFIVRMGLSLQRLYRLAQTPRDAETAVYLVKHPGVHDLLHTISDISASEWEILTSGRFDGFLWSGAEDDGVVVPGESPPSSASRMMSPGAAPGRPVSRNAPATTTTAYCTPGVSAAASSSSAAAYPSRSAVTHDEEVEVATLAELEREIFNGMEALEDAFEKLHEKAMAVREALRRRGAALQMSLQQRRRAGVIDVLPLSGSSGAYDRPAWADEESVDGADSEWGGDDLSELAPDDSASQVSSNRLRRPKRRRERATPAPIEEEDEQ
ncbi:uncharacterized protein P884DRAFT_274659 [Thermothelomyces heterothallicus CBS 202.75]|uniref:uncharacterized protein n=1 Tax=Thermothelomyces heterothallicus CBS 202.75 TaxID=1149848 RepID=UPI0037443E99